jgi:hypothetical protein
MDIDAASLLRCCPRSAPPRPAGRCRRAHPEQFQMSEEGDDRCAVLMSAHRAGAPKREETLPVPSSDQRNNPGTLRPRFSAQRNDPGTFRPRSSAQRNDTGTLRPRSSAQRNDLGALRPPFSARRNGLGTFRPPFSAQRNDPEAFRPRSSGQRNDPGTLRPHFSAKLTHPARSPRLFPHFTPSRVIVAADKNAVPSLFSLPPSRPLPVASQLTAAPYKPRTHEHPWPA